MIRKIVFLVLLCAGFAQAQSHLQPYRNQTAKQIANVTHLQRMDTTFFHTRIGDYGRDYVAAIEARGLSPYDLTTFAAAKDTARARNRLFLIPGFYTTTVFSPTSADSNLLAWDMRYAKWKAYGTRQWGFGSVTEADSLNRFQKIVDSTTAGGVVRLGDGTWSFASYTQSVSRPMRIEGTTAPRPGTSTISWPWSQHGTLLKSTSSTSTVNLLNIGYPGVDVSNLTLLGNNRANGNGFYGYRGDGTQTTQGDYSFRDALSLFHGGDGVRFVNPDGNLLQDVDSFGNNGYGIVITSSYGNFLDGNQSVPSSNGNVGTATRIIGGRTRFNQDGGFKSFQQAGNIIIGLECISDSTVNYYEKGLGTTSQSAEFGNTNSRTVAIGNDFEFVVPPASFAGGGNRVSNMRLHNSRNGTFVGNYWGSVHTQGTYTADATTSATQIVDTEIIQMPTNYYAGWFIDNITRSVNDAEITASSNSGSSTILTVSVASQASGDSYRLQKNPDRGVYGDSLWSALFINNNHASVADSPFVFKNFAYPFFLGSSVNLDPETDLDTLAAVSGSTELRYLSIAHDKLTTGGNPQITTNGELTIEVNPSYGQGDSLNIRNLDSSFGVRVEATGVIDLQPIVTTDTGTQGDVNFHRLVSDDIRPEVRYYFDADTSGSVRRAWLSFQGSSGQPNRITLSGSTDTTTIGIASGMEMTGDDSTARYIDVLASTTKPTVAVSNNRIRLYSKTDHLRYTEDNSRDYPLGFRYGGATASTDSLTLPDGTFTNVTGTDSIKYITPKSPGHEYTIQFDGALVVVDASGIGNIDLGSDFTTSATDVLRIVMNSAGTRWLQISRSDN